MLKWFIRPALSGLVLISGPIACAPDKHSRSAYDPKPPAICGAGGCTSFAALGLGATRELHLGDRLIFSSRPARVRVTSECKIEKQNVHADAAFSLDEIDLAAVLPIRALTSDLFGTTCSLELRLFDDAGSSHVFYLGTSDLREADAAQVKLERVAAAENFKTRAYGLPNMHDLRAYSKNEGRARMLCSDFASPTINFDGAIDLSYFDLKKGEEVPPRQLCRLSVEENGRRALSNLIPITFSETIGKLSLLEVNDVRDGEGEADLNDLHDGRTVPLMRWRFKNMSRTPHRLRLAAPASTRSEYLTQDFSLLAVVAPNEKLLKWGPREVLVAPGATADLNLSVSFPFLCGGSATRGIAIVPLGPATMEELNETGESLMVKTLTLPPAFHFWRAGHRFGEIREVRQIAPCD